MDRMTEETALELIEEMRGLRKKASVAEAQARRLRKHTRWLWGVMVAFVIGAGFLVNAVHTANDAADEARAAAKLSQQSQVISCESGNLRLAGQRKIWSFFFEVTAASAKAQREPRAVLNFYDDYLHWITDEVLPDRDCEHLSQTIDEPGPPPDFRHALEQSLKHHKG